MRLDVRPILYAPGEEIPFRMELDLSGMEIHGRRPAARPVLVEGRVRNSADALSLDLTASTVLDAVCDRCGKAFEKAVEIPYRCLLAQELQNDESDDIELLEDGQADVEDLARTAFLLGMDTKTLCSEDCKGLCPRCGADLNEGPCSCAGEPDPRWAVLAGLLEDRSGDPPA